jgi:DNA-binding HxlR family transcriptional regulator
MAVASPRRSMSTGISDAEVRPAHDQGACVAGASTADVLRLLSAGATGAILMALGGRSLRTKELTEKVKGYTPRTVYRYAEKLTAMGVIERHEEPGVPSKVVHTLNEPSGRELYELVDGYANASLTRLPNGEIDAHAWGSIALLADLWESGMIDELNRGPKSSTELARIEHGLSYHQVNRRAGLFAIGGLLHETSAGRRRNYSLTDKARRGMALIAGVGRWRRRYVLPQGSIGLTPREVGRVLRTALPLVTLPEHAGKSLGMEVAAEKMPNGESDVVWASIDRGGSVFNWSEPVPKVDGHARGRVVTFVDAILDGPGDGLNTEGDECLISACLERLHSTLWAVWLEPSPTSAKTMAGRSDGA